MVSPRAHRFKNPRFRGGRAGSDASTAWQSKFWRARPGPCGCRLRVGTRAPEVSQRQLAQADRIIGMGQALVDQPSPLGKETASTTRGGAAGGAGSGHSSRVTAAAWSGYPGIRRTAFDRVTRRGERRPIGADRSRHYFKQLSVFGSHHDGAVLRRHDASTPALPASARQPPE